MESKSPFSDFAKVYDAFMHYIDYQGWVEYICQLIQLHQIKGKKLLDLACGTGICTILFAQKGFEVTGVDLSGDMLINATNKPETKEFGIKFSCQDMRDFKIDTQVNIVTCLYDSLNYLLNKEDLEKTFNSVYRSLEEGGGFIFDMNTEYALRKIWGSKILWRNEGGVKSVWKTKYDHKTGISTLHLTWATRENGIKKKHYEIHKEASYTNDDIKNLLEKVGFREVKLYTHNTFQPPIEVTSRIMVVAIK